uniref:Uncharacterized protein n=1 Tax=Chromera velia CCMP2878 TaxID=1169474 RepID=A0A0G4GK88_9ALVE|eukprot:Cvel_22282.t1-p1 / transcript=Cvel_22282.t1 / gene=Cvel_22282 / organism=Chromera_velia_CCMP2878 / gene_product=hypothetical protein / transcript_product=hypothetical protein / location=Cvel_scaffold2175:18053-23694(+) / protein_length=805 / sequence_SO=supercontig / SO=protein_coding / is_pseudo=false
MPSGATAIVRVSAFAFGFSFLLPWNAQVQVMQFLDRYAFSAERMPEGFNADWRFCSVQTYALSCLVTQSIMVVGGGFFSENTRVLGSLTVIAVAALLFPLIFTKMSGTAAGFVLGCVLCGMMGVGASAGVSSVVGILNNVDPRTTALVSTGSGCAAVFCFVCALLGRPYLRTDEWDLAVALFFGISALLVSATLCLYCSFRQDPSVRQGMAALRKSIRQGGTRSRQQGGFLSRGSTGDESIEGGEEGGGTVGVAVTSTALPPRMISNFAVAAGRARSVLVRARQDDGPDQRLLRIESSKEEHREGESSPEFVPTSSEAVAVQGGGGGGNWRTLSSATGAGGGGRDSLHTVGGRTDAEFFSFGPDGTILVGGSDHTADSSPMHGGGAELKDARRRVPVRSSTAPDPKSLACVDARRYGYPSPPQEPALHPVGAVGGVAAAPPEVLPVQDLGMPAMMMRMQVKSDRGDERGWGGVRGEDGSGGALQSSQLSASRQSDSDSGWVLEGEELHEANFRDLTGGRSGGRVKGHHLTSSSEASEDLVGRLPADMELGGRGDDRVEPLEGPVFVHPVVTAAHVTWACLFDITSILLTCSMTYFLYPVFLQRLGAVRWFEEDENFRIWLFGVAQVADSMGSVITFLGYGVHGWRRACTIAARFVFLPIFMLSLNLQVRPDGSGSALRVVLMDEIFLIVAAFVMLITKTWLVTSSVVKASERVGSPAEKRVAGFICFLCTTLGLLIGALFAPLAERAIDPLGMLKAKGGGTGGGQLLGEELPESGSDMGGVAEIRTPVPYPVWAPERSAWTTSVW